MIAEIAELRPSDIKKDRPRIYSNTPSQPKNPKHTTIQKDTLPSLTKPNTHQYTHIEVDGAHANLNATQQQHPALTMLSHIEKLRQSCAEKDLENMKLRHENNTLRQVERRQTKDFRDLETQNNDYPRIIRGLREEAAALKVKLKEYFSHLTNDSRLIRNLNKDLRLMKDLNHQNQLLIQSKGLDERENLRLKLEDSNNHFEAQSKTLSDAQHRFELVEKNLVQENNNYRAKLKSFVSENQVFKEKLEKLNILLKEKDKEIASLSIYRFNAVHRTKHDTICKNCVKREREELERKRLHQLLEKLPKIGFGETKATDSTSITVELSISKYISSSLFNLQSNNTSTVTVESALLLIGDGNQNVDSFPLEQLFSNIVIRCSEDPQFSQNVQELNLVPDDFSIDEEGVLNISTDDSSTTKVQLEIPTINDNPNVSTEKQPDVVSLENVEVISSKTTLPKKVFNVKFFGSPDKKLIKGFKVRFSGLKTSSYYYFQCFTMNGTLRGDHIKLDRGILVDLLPPKPQKPTIKILQNSNASEIKLFIPPVIQTLGESKVVSYHVYHSNNKDMNDKFLIADIVSDDFELPEVTNHQTNNASTEADAAFTVGFVDEENESPPNFKDDTIWTMANRIQAPALLIGDVEVPYEVEKVTEEIRYLTFVYGEAELLVEHYFQISAINKMGEGECSDTTDSAILDCEPCQPSRPILKRENANSIRFSSVIEKNKGSSVSSYKVILIKSKSEPKSTISTKQSKKIRNSSDALVGPSTTKKSKLARPNTPHTLLEKAVSFSNVAPQLTTSIFEEIEEIIIQVPKQTQAFGDTNVVLPTELSYVVEGLPFGTRFKIKIVARNAAGNSEESALSDEIDIEHMISTPTKLPMFKILSTSSVEFRFTDFNEQTVKKESNSSNVWMEIAGVAIYKRKIYSSLESDMHNAVLEIDGLSVATPDLTIDNLSKGQQYFFAFSYVGASNMEGALSSPLFVPLAAAIQLPRTPDEDHQQLDLVLSEPEPRLSSLSKRGSLSLRSLAAQGNKSRSKYSMERISISNLNSSQKVLNMHNGMPAHHSEKNLAIALGESAPNSITVDEIKEAGSSEGHKFEKRGSLVEGGDKMAQKNFNKKLNNLMALNKMKNKK